MVSGAVVTQDREEREEYLSSSGTIALSLDSDYKEYQEVIHQPELTT